MILRLTSVCLSSARPINENAGTGIYICQQMSMLVSPSSTTRKAPTACQITPIIPRRPTMTLTITKCLSLFQSSEIRISTDKVS